MLAWSRAQVKDPSPMAVVKCLATLRLLMTLPTRTPILSGSLRWPASAMAVTLASSASVAESSRSRWAARSASRAGLWQAISRSPGESGELISARSWVSNGLFCSGPPSSASFLIAGARRRVIQAIPGSSLRALIRALVITPRSPPHDRLGDPELVPHHRHRLGERFGVAGVAGEHPHRDRAPIPGGEQPVFDLRLAALAVAGVPERGQLAMAAFHPRRRQVEQGHPALVQVAAGQLSLD